MDMESPQDNKASPELGVRSLDMLGYSPAYGLTRLDTAINDEQKLTSKPPQIVKITVKSNNKPSKLLPRRNQAETDNERLKLSGSTPFANKSSVPNQTPRARSRATRKNSEASLPSIAPSVKSKAASEMSTTSSSFHRVTPYYDSDFGFHFERLCPGAGMSQHKEPPQDEQDLSEEIANTANKHIYSLQIVSTAHRGSKRTESVHSLLNTIWPPASPVLLERSRSMSRPLSRSGTRLSSASGKTLSNKGKLQQPERLVRSKTNHFGSFSKDNSSGTSPKQKERISSSLPKINSVGLTLNALATKAKK